MGTGAVKLKIDKNLNTSGPYNFYTILQIILKLFLYCSFSQQYWHLSPGAMFDFKFWFNSLSKNNNKEYN